MKDSCHFWAGRLARGRDVPRQINDGRLSPASRAEWYAGWDAEDAIRGVRERTVEQAVEFDQAQAVLREFLNRHGR